VPLLKKKNSREMLEEVAVVVEAAEVAELKGPPTQHVRHLPAKLAEREAELSATKRTSLPFERVLGLCCPRL